MVLSEKQRLFIGLAVPDDVRRQLLMRLDGWRERFAFARWAHPDDWHITLHFIGETDADRIPAIVRALDESAAGARPFDVELRGLGTFGPPARPAASDARAQVRGRSAMEPGVSGGRDVRRVLDRAGRLPVPQPARPFPDVRDPPSGAVR